MNIAFLTEDIFGIGGVQRVVSTLANAMAPGNNVSIICINKSIKVDRNIYQLDERVIVKNPKELQQINRGQYFKKGLRYINKKYFGFKNVGVLNYIYITKLDKDILSDFLNRNQFDIVVAAQLKLSMLLGSVADKVTTKCYGWQHNTFEAYFNTPHKYYWNQQALAKKYLARLEGCVVLSKADEEQYAKEIGLQTRCIYNPVHIVGGYEDATNKKQVSEQQIGAKKTNEQGIKRILFVGRLVKEQKGLDYLVEIIKRCLAYNYRFEIVGDGADRPYLEAEIHQSGLERKVRFCGSTKNIQDYYNNADLLVSTSRWEGFGLTLVEAMQFGIPCVAFDNSGPREILGDSGAGIIVSKYDIVSFVESIHMILEDDEKYDQFSIAARRRYQDFNPDIIAVEWLKFLGEGYNGK